MIAWMDSIFNPQSYQIYGVDLKIILCFGHLFRTANKITLQQTYKNIAYQLIMRIVIMIIWIENKRYKKKSTKFFQI